MRLPWAVVLPLLIICIATDWYIFRRVCRTVDRHKKLWRSVAALSTAACYALIAFIILSPKHSTSDQWLVGLMWCIFAFISIYLSKFVFIIVDVLQRLFAKRCTVSLGSICAVLAFFVLWVHALSDRNRIEVNTVGIDGAPIGFEGYKIVQISDLHAGTWGNDTTFVSHMVDEINALNPDVVVFTGDIVTRRSAELKPFVSTLSRISAPVYSVSGNHDYGEYYRWTDSVAKLQDFKRLTALEEACGWKMLNNETAWLHSEGDSIALIGVENIGDPPFKVYGSLTQAYQGSLADVNYKILLSHNPKHWEDSIEHDESKNIALTLAGHTHAMQIKVFGLSPAALRYSKWAGLYGDRRKLYVNIGVGEVAYPVRLGALPEITVFELRK